MMSTKILASRGATMAARNQSLKQKVGRTMSTIVPRVGTNPNSLAWVGAAAVAATTVVAFSLTNKEYYEKGKTFCDAGLPVISVGESVKEPDTGIV